MSIEVISVGNEILCGQVVNTNGAYLGRRLDEEGYDVVCQTTLPDEKSRLTQGLKERLERSSVVIATGGVGPTLDDITVQCASSLFSSPSTPLRNSLGSAPGHYFKDQHRRLLLLPGVPQEMEAMFEQEAIPLLKQTHPPQSRRYQTKLHFSMLSETEVDPFLRELQTQSAIEAGIYPSYSKLTVVLRGKEQEAVEKAKEALKRQFRSHAYESASGKIEEAIQQWMVHHHKTLACAESCTGGALAAALTAIPGASRYFLGSLVTYSNSLKEHLLHVSSKTLSTQGAVSAETVHEMWRGVLQATGADVGVAVSGIAGPAGGSVEKPVGTVYYAIGFKNRDPEIGSFHAGGVRGVVILRATRRLLGLLWEKLK